jgi:hypothetical protein
MKSTTTQRFWKCYDALPAEVRKQAKDAYELFSSNPYYPSLHFKRVHSSRAVFSVRINIDYRAVGILEGNEITWFWIGSHTQYEALIKRFRNA